MFRFPWCQIARQRMSLLCRRAAQCRCRQDSSRLAKSTVPLFFGVHFRSANSSRNVSVRSAACTSAGPARNKPEPSVSQNVSQHHGDVPPPATHIPMLAVICVIPMRLILRYLRKDAPENHRCRERQSSCSCRNTPAGIDQIDVRNMVSIGNVLRASPFSP